MENKQNIPDPIKSNETNKTTSSPRKKLLDPETKLRPATTQQRKNNDLRK